MTFDELDFAPHPAGLGGVMARVRFANGWGLSVIRTPYSYGGASGLYEVAELRNGELCHETVEGWFTPERVTARLAELEQRAALAEVLH